MTHLGGHRPFGEGLRVITDEAHLALVNSSVHSLEENPIVVSGFEELLAA